MFVKISYSRYHWKNNPKDILYSKRNLFLSTMSYRSINKSVYGIELTKKETKI